MTLKKITINIGIILLFISPIAHASIFQQAMSSASSHQDIYQVELIVFNYLPLDLNNNNLWQDFTDIIPSTDTISLQNINQNELNQFNNNQGQISINQLQLYSLLPPSQYLLKKELQRLRRSNAYQILNHLAWLQPITDTWHAKAIYITGGNQFQIGNNIYQLTGTIRLTQANYINVNANLELVEPADDQLKSYSLHTYRRMRPNQLNYIDSPVLGMLIMIKSLNAKT